MQKNWHFGENYYDVKNVRAIRMEYFVISLKKTPYRLEEFYKCNSHLNNIKHFEAIDSSDISRDDLISQNVILPDNRFKVGALGNMLSHIALWKYAVENNTPLTIFEDDAIAHIKFLEISSDILNKLNHLYDFVGYGWNFDADLWASNIPFLSPFLTKFNQNSLRTHKHSYLVADLSAIALKVYFSCGGTIGYTISPAGAQKFLQQSLPIGADLTLQIPSGDRIDFPLWGLDMALSKVYSISRSYISFPPIVLTDNNIAASTVNI